MSTLADAAAYPVELQVKTDALARKMYAFVCSHTDAVAPIAAEQTHVGALKVRALVYVTINQAKTVFIAADTPAGDPRAIVRFCAPCPSGTPLAQRLDEAVRVLSVGVAPGP